MKRHRSIAIACFMLLLTLLVAAGQSPKTKVIVQADSAETAAAVVEAHGGRVAEQLAIINSVAAEIPQDNLAALEQDNRVAAVFVDHGVNAAGNRQAATKLCYRPSPILRAGAP